jgi:hypothetical protein
MSRLRRVAAGAPSALGVVLACALLVVLATTPIGAPPLSLQSGQATFTIQGRIYDQLPGGDGARGCAGDLAPLSPGVTRCLTLRVENRLARGIAVRSLATELDPDFPAPPEGCSADRLSLPRFSGSILVPSHGSATSPGLPIRLENARTDQNDCQQTVLHFRFTGTATYADRAEHEALPDTGAGLSLRTLVWLVLLAGGLVVTGLLLVLAARRDRPGVRR